MNSFGSKIKDIEARINRLRTLGVSSSSSLAIAEYTVKINWKIIAIRIGASGEIFEVGASQYAYVRIHTKNNQPALLNFQYISPLNFGERNIFNGKTLENLGSNYNYGILLYMYGDENDRRAIEQGQTLPTQTYTFKILSTSEITSIDIVYKDHPIYDSRQP